MILSMIYFGNPLLRKKCKPVVEVTAETKSFIADMIETMESQRGLGIAAPQVGSDLRVFVTKVPKYEEDKEVSPGHIRVFINPEILEYSEDKSTLTEGCLSIPKVYGNVVRPYKIKVKATDIDGNDFTLDLEGLEAHCFLHENDHINGVLFIDRMDKKERKLIENDLKKIKKKYSS